MFLLWYFPLDLQGIDFTTGLDSNVGEDYAEGVRHGRVFRICGGF